MADTSGRKLGTGHFDKIVDSSGRELLVSEISTLGDSSESYSSVSQALDENLMEGTIVRTLGYHSVGDGGGNFYAVTDAGDLTPDGGSVISIPESGLALVALFQGEPRLEQFGAIGDGVTDDSEAWQAAVNSGYSSISGRDGATYRIDDVTADGPLHVHGNFSVRKLSKDRNSLQLKTGDYKISFSGITFYGLYEDGDTGIVSEIEVTDYSGNGLELSFEDCAFGDTTWSGFSTGDPTNGSISSVTFDRCKTLGTIRQKTGVSENNPAAIRVHNAGRLIVRHHTGLGSGVFDLGDGTLDGIVEAPAFSFFVKDTRVTLEDSDFTGTGGFICYTGCDYSTYSRCKFENCLYGLSVQSAKDPKIIDCQFLGIRVPYRGAIHLQPYARISSYGRRVEHTIGSYIKGCRFEGNSVDLTITGTHANAGQYGVADTRARNNLIEECLFLNPQNQHALLTDLEARFSRCTFIGAYYGKSSQGLQFGVEYNTSKPGGCLDNVFTDCSFSSAGGGSTSAINSQNFNGKDPNFRVFVNRSRFAGYDKMDLSVVYLKFANTSEFTENHFENEPSRAFTAAESRRAVFKDNTGLAYPSAITIQLASVDQIVSDHDARGLVSEFYSQIKPTVTSYALGSRAIKPNPSAGSTNAWVLTENGWVAG